jgi:hypothetical protein
VRDTTRDSSDQRSLGIPMPEAAHAELTTLVLTKNPNYGCSRPQRFDEFRYPCGQSTSQARSRWAA